MWLVTSFNVKEHEVTIHLMWLIDQMQVEVSEEVVGKAM